MNCKIKKLSKHYKIDKILENYNDIKLKLRNILNENVFIKTNNKINIINKSLTDSAIPTNLTRYCICVSLKPESIVLYESSVVNQHTLETEPVLYKIMDECGLTFDNIYLDILNDNLKIADYIQFFLPVTMDKNKINSMFESIEKIMTMCGYYLAINPEIRYTNEHGLEYVIQYEPNEPEFIKLWLPEKLHHVTTVKLSEEIKQNGFMPGTNDIFNYNPRIYFADRVDGSIIRHISRRYGKLLLIPGTTNLAEFADIIINTPNNVRFYKDYHMPDIYSYFTFDKIDPKYIDSIKILRISQLMMKMWNEYFK